MTRFVTQLILSFVLLVNADLAHAYVDINLQMQLGNPSNATADTNNHTHYLVQRTVEALDYNDNLGHCRSDLLKDTCGHGQNHSVCIQSS